MKHWADVLDEARAIVFERADALEESDLQLLTYILVAAGIFVAFHALTRPRPVVSSVDAYARGYRAAMLDVLRMKEEPEGVK